MAAKKKQTLTRPKTGAERHRSGDLTAPEEARLNFLRWLDSGMVVPGQRLSEAELIDRLGMSKGPIREAMQRLSTEEVVEIIPYRGYRVHSITRKDVVEIFDVSEVIFGLAARLVSERTEKCKVQLKALLSFVQQEHPIRVAELQRVHTETIEMCGSRQVLVHDMRLRTPLFPAQFRSLFMKPAPGNVLTSASRYLSAAMQSEPGKSESHARRYIRNMKKLFIAAASD